MRTILRRILTCFFATQVFSCIVIARLASTHFAAAYDLALAAIAALMLIAVVIALRGES